MQRNRIIAQYLFAVAIVRHGNVCVMLRLEMLSRGFTAHEHIIEFDLINMNARLYDPEIGAKIGSAIVSNYFTSVLSSGNGKYTLMQAFATSISTLQSIGIDYLSNIGNKSLNEATGRNASNTKEESQRIWDRASVETKSKIATRYSAYAADMSDPSRTSGYEDLFQVWEYEGEQAVVFYKSDEVQFNIVREKRGLIVNFSMTNPEFYSGDATSKALLGEVIIEGHFHPTLVLARGSNIQIPYTTDYIHKQSGDFVLKGTKPSSTDYDGSNSQIKFIYDGNTLQYYIRTFRKDYTGKIKW